MRIAADVIKHLLRPGKRRFGVDDPFSVLQGAMKERNSWASCRCSREPKKRSLPKSKAFSKYFKNKPRNRRDKTRTGRRKPGRQEIQRTPSLWRPRDVEADPADWSPNNRNRIDLEGSADGSKPHCRVTNTDVGLP